MIFHLDFMFVRVTAVSIVCSGVASESISDTFDSTPWTEPMKYSK